VNIYATVDDKKNRLGPAKETQRKEL